GADCDSVGATSQRRERYRQYGAEGPQGEHGGSQRIASRSLFSSANRSRLEIQAGAFVNLGDEFGFTRSGDAPVRVTTTSVRSLCSTRSADPESAPTRGSNLCS